MFILTLIYFIISDLDIFTVLFSISLSLQIAAILLDLIFYSSKDGLIAFKWSHSFLYKSTKMNKMSCKIIWVISCILLDAYFIVLYFGKFVYYITHVGREE